MSSGVKLQHFPRIRTLFKEIQLLVSKFVEIFANTQLLSKLWNLRQLTKLPCKASRLVTSSTAHESSGLCSLMPSVQIYSGHWYCWWPRRPHPLKVPEMQISHSQIESCALEMLEESHVNSFGLCVIFSFPNCLDLVCFHVDLQGGDASWTRGYWRKISLFVRWDNFQLTWL